MPRPRAQSARKDVKLTRADILTGMYEVGTHRLIPTDTCAIENETAKKVTLAIRDIMARWGMEPTTRTRARVSRATPCAWDKSGEVLVTVVTNGESFPHRRPSVASLRAACPK